MTNFVDVILRLRGLLAFKPKRIQASFWLSERAVSI
jgi:hypothetical protein